MFRNYRVFTKVPYRVLIWVLYPLAAILGCILIMSGVTGVGPFSPGAAASVLLSCICLVEIIQDAFMFLGVQAKERNYMEFLKVSEKGLAVYKNAMIADLIRRALCIAVVYAANLSLGHLFFGFVCTKMDVAWSIQYALFTFFMSTLGVYICRYFTSVWVNLSVAYCANFIALIVMYVCNLVEDGVVVKSVIVAVLAIVISIISVKTVEKKVEESYYDERY